MYNSLYDRLLGIMGNLLEAYTVALFLPSRPEGGQSVYVLTGAFSLGDKVNYQAAFQPKEGLLGLILSNNEPLFIPSFDQRRSTLGYYKDNEEERLKAFMGCPLPGGKGVLCVDTKRHYVFADKDKKLLLTFAELLAGLYDLQRQDMARNAALRHYAALRQIHILINEYVSWSEFVPIFLDIISKASHYEYCALCVLENNNESFYTVVGENYTLALKKDRPERYGLRDGLAGWVFRNGRILALGGTDSSPGGHLFSSLVNMPSFNSVLAVPLIVQSKVMGVLCLASAAPVDTGAEIQEFAGVASGHLAMFLENFQLKEEIRHLRKKLKQGEA